MNNSAVIACLVFGKFLFFFNQYDPQPCIPLLQLQSGCKAYNTTAYYYYIRVQCLKIKSSILRILN